MVAPSSLSFTALDFETANSDRSSACAVGAVKVRNGQVVETFRSLIHPPDDACTFHTVNSSIHGLSAVSVINAPEWPEIFPEFRSFVDGDLVVGHNVIFDVSVLLNVCSSYDIEWPEWDTACTYRVARRLLKIPSYTLPWVANHLDLGSFDHHDPLADARMSAEVFLVFAGMKGVESARALSAAVGLAPTKTFIDDVNDAPSMPGPPPDFPMELGIEGSREEHAGSGFAGQYVCFTGGLKSMVRDQARALIAEHGGTAQSEVTSQTTVVVTGDFNARTFRPGASFSRKLQKAFNLVEEGRPLEVITEDAFISRLSLSQEELQAGVAANGARKSKLPAYVVEQGRKHLGGNDFSLAFRRALANPDGRANAGTTCIWCGRVVQSDAHWIHRDRHICGAQCNERFKRAAKRAWSRANIEFRNGIGY